MATRTRNWQKRIVVLALASLLLIVMVRWFEYQSVFQPSASFWVSGDVLGRPFEDVSLTTRDGVRLHGWFFPAAADSARRHLAILHCHGNGGNISHRVEVADALLETGVNVLLLDYRGYGHSAGRPSEEGTYLDAQAAHAWLVARGFAATNLIAFGESLGGGVAAELALREPLGGLVLQSSFTSIPDLGAELYPFLPVRRLARIRYDTFAKLPRIHVPLLVLHGRNDTLIGFTHAGRNFAVANPPKQFSELAGDHNDFLQAGRARFVEGFERFLESLLDRPDPPAAATSPGP